MKHLRWRLLAALSAALLLEACAGSVSDPLAQSATLVPDTKAGVNLDNLPPPVQRLDVAVYNFPDLTGQNKPNDNFAEFSRATTQGGAAILVDALTKAGGGQWFNVVERNDLQSLLQERQVIQTPETRSRAQRRRACLRCALPGFSLRGESLGMTQMKRRAALAQTGSGPAATYNIVRTL